MHFRKAAVRLTAALLTVSALLTPAFAVTGTVATGGDVLRVRAEGNTSAEILKNISDGTQVEVLGITKDGWYQVSVEDIKGFVSGDFLSVPEGSDVPEVFEPYYAKVTCSSSLNIRSGPGTGYAKVGKLSSGAVVKIIGAADGWLQTESGYVSAEYMEKTEAPAANTKAATSKGQEVVNYALQFVGYPYVYGGSSPSGFDCSGFTSYVYKHFGVSLNRSAADQLDNGTPVSKSDLRPGDLLLFKKGNSSKRATHAALYIGNGQFVHASTAKTGVKINKLTDSYYTKGLVGCRRIFN